MVDDIINEILSYEEFVEDDHNALERALKSMRMNYQTSGVNETLNQQSFSETSALYLYRKYEKVAKSFNREKDRHYIHLDLTLQEQGMDKRGDKSRRESQVTSSESYVSVLEQSARMDCLAGLLKDLYYRVCRRGDYLENISNNYRKELNADLRSM